jgi:hypothetical protein
MTRKVVQQPDGQWAVYSTVIEDFVVEDASREEVLEVEGERAKQQRVEQVERVMAEHEGATSRGETYADLRERADNAGLGEASGAASDDTG